MAAFETEILIKDEKKLLHENCSSAPNFVTVLKVENEAQTNGAVCKLPQPPVNKKLDKRINKHREIKMLNDRASLASSLSHAETMNGNFSGPEDTETRSLLSSLTDTAPSTGSKQNGSVLVHIEPVVMETKQKDVCLIQDSPFYIHKIAQTEKLDEFKRLFYQDPTRLLLKDNAKTWLPIQYAVFKNKIKIIDFIIENSEPSKTSSSLGIKLLSCNPETKLILFFRYDQHE